MTDGIAHVRSVHQPGPSMPTRPSSQLTIPSLGLSSQRHSSETTTQLVTTGRKYMARKMVTPLQPRC